MDKLPGWIFLIIGILWLLPLLGLTFLESVDMWLTAIGFLVLGIMKLMDK